MRPADPALLRELERVVGPRRVLARPIDRLARSADASIYRLIPEVVVRPRDVDAVRGLLACARAFRRPLTFRTAGTSLSGQAVTDGILVELAHDWGRFRVQEGGASVWSQPGVVGGHLNRVLAPYARRLGPDPASIDAAMIGGIVANNASGMCCGVAQNSYHTLAAMTFVLADGTSVDTAAAGADAAFAAARPDLHGALAALRDAIRADEELVALIRRRLALKNTTGYALAAFLDHDRPADIVSHLLVGSQGTLGFVADVTLRTVPEPPARATALLFFRELRDAAAAVPALTQAGAAALELMDASSLRSQAALRTLPVAVEARTAALLVELREADEAALDAAVARAQTALADAPLAAPAAFTRDTAERDAQWRLRKGLFPAVGALRPPGTAVVIEDVAVPPARLADAVDELHALFARHGFEDAIVFGHARDGNLHFVFARDFAREDVVRAYDDFMRGLVALVVRYDGSLKAEHGSGRNMAPFVRDEWGARAYDVMRRVKALLDPDGILSPGVVLTDDPQAHLRHLKALPAVAPVVDACIECGFCEPRCPSRDLTLSPRQRIVAARAMAALEESGDRATAASVRRDFAYEGDATCAGDSMCATSCPVAIDTGALVKQLRAAARSRQDRRLAGWTARHLGLATAAARTALRLARALRTLPLGPRALDALSAAGHRLAPSLVPRLRPEVALPRAARPSRAPAAADGPPVVCFRPCLSRVLGPLPGEPDAVALPALLARAGFAVVEPASPDALCCGMPFASKGHPDAARVAAVRTFEALWQASDGGRLTVVTDASPCAGALQEHAREEARRLRIRDFASFWAESGLPQRPPSRRQKAAVLHPTCTLVKNGGLPDLLRVARACADEVVVPPSAECCGFAGDKGFLVPELTASATRREADEVRALEAAGAGLYSTCRTCEIGMTRAVGAPYRSLVQLVADTL
ncbi:MAG: FAD-binding and (Fe-S)-binding domain-containing protein [Vicinamibacteria bacterium]